MAIKVELDEQLERKFRELAMRKYGYSKGSIKKAAENAIKHWTDEGGIEKTTDQRILNKEKRGNPVELIVGLLADTKAKKKTSVQLQHESAELWTKRK